MLRALFLTFSAAILTIAAALPVQAEELERRQLRIGGGEVRGFFYPEAGALCRILDSDAAGQKYDCMVKPSSGSSANIAALRAGQIDIAVMQSKAQHLAYRGDAPFKEQGAFENMRALFSLHGEAMAVLVRNDAEVKSVADLKGKRVNLGLAESFQRDMADMLLAAYGLKPEDFAATLAIDLGEMRDALCDARIDAAFVTAVHPAALVQSALTDCDAVLLDLGGNEMDAMLKQAPYLADLTIPAGSYGGQDADIKTFGTVATVVTTSSLPQEAGYDLVKSVFANFDVFSTMLPVLDGLVPAAMSKDGRSAPLHDGAARYFDEADLD